MQTLTTEQMQERFSAAYEALPETYKADSCLEFFLDVNDNLCAEYDLGGEYLWNGTTWVVICMQK